jgi:hypothetical protein
MFGINGTEALLVALWFIGIASAIAAYVNGHRGLRGVMLIAVAVVVPVLGSLLAVAVFAMHVRREAQHADHPVTR